MFDQQKFNALDDKRLQLVDTLSDINAQLGQTRRLAPDGTRELTRVEYSQWRNKAVVAKQRFERELRLVNHTLKRMRQERNEQAIGAAGINPADPLSLIAAAHVLLRRLASEGVDLDEKEQAVVDGLRHYLQHTPASAEPRQVLDGQAASR